jgi:hypothetical protein
MHLRILTVKNHQILEAVAMPALVWMHGKAATHARDAIQAELRRLGYDSYVAWHDNEAHASVGMGWILDARGSVTDVSVILLKCGGGIGGLVLGKCKEVLERLFPGGEQLG